jgi:hypothetical protein
VTEIVLLEKIHHNAATLLAEHSFTNVKEIGSALLDLLAYSCCSPLLDYLNGLKFLNVF